jgi:hypothetical protein
MCAAIRRRGFETQGTAFGFGVSEMTKMTADGREDDNVFIYCEEPVECN